MLAVQPAYYFPSFSGISGTKLPKAEAQALRKTVETLVSFPRDSYDLPSLAKTAEYLKQQWEGMGYTVEEQPFKLYGKLYKNVMTFYGPPDAERIVIGAHYDTHKGYPGADDNASGLAVLLGLSRLLKQHQPKLNKRIDLVAYTLEERTLNGSRHHARMLRKQGVRVKGMISLECVGFYSDQPGSQKLPLKFLLKKFYPTVGNFIGVIGDVFSRNWISEVTQAIRKHSPISAEKLAGPMLPLSIFRSDHASYRLHGKVPALMLTDTANFRNPNYHKSTDLPETLDYDRMAQVAQGLYGLVTQQV